MCSTFHPSLSTRWRKRACLDPSAPGRHSQPEGDSCLQYRQEGDPDARFSPQEGASTDEKLSQPGVSSKPDACLSQQEGASNDEIPSKQEVASPNPIIILSNQEEERDTVENVDEENDNNQLPTPPTEYPHPKHPPQTWYPLPSHYPDLE